MTADEAEVLRDWLHGWPTRATELLSDVKAEFAVAVEMRHRLRARRAWRIWRELAAMLAAHGLSFDPAPELPDFAKDRPSSWRWTPNGHHVC